MKTCHCCKKEIPKDAESHAVFMTPNYRDTPFCEIPIKELKDSTIFECGACHEKAVATFNTRTLGKNTILEF